MARWIKKNKIQLYPAYKRLTLALRTHRIKVKGWKKTFHKWKPEESHIYTRQMILSKKQSPETMVLLWRGQFLKKTLPISNSNTNALNTRATKYIKQILKKLKGETDNNTTLIGNYTTTLSVGIGHAVKKSREHWTWIIHETKWTQQTHTRHSIWQQNTHSSQVHTEYSEW